MQHAKTVLKNPMPGEPSLEYYRTVELDLLNHLVGCIQHLDLELKFHELLSAEYETAAELTKEHDEVVKFLADN